MNSSEWAKLLSLAGQPMSFVWEGLINESAILRSAASVLKDAVNFSRLGSPAVISMRSTTKIDKETARFENEIRKGISAILGSIIVSEDFTVKVDYVGNDYFRVTISKNSS